MNRIYQGRVSKVELLHGKDEQPTPLDEEILWQHHKLFQDAVNYYIVALASLGTSPESSLTELRRLLETVWQSANKQGQVRPGMSESLRRTWELESPPTLPEAVARFQEPLSRHAVENREIELAGESLLNDLGGDGSIQQGGAEYWPYFCQSGFKRGVTFPREASQLSKEKAVRQVPRLVWHSRAERHVAKIHRVLEQRYFCNVSGSGTLLDQARSKQVFLDALNDLLSANAISKEQEDQYLQKLSESVPQVAEYAGGSINKDTLKRRFYAFLVFKHLSPDVAGLSLLRRIYESPKRKALAKRQVTKKKEKIEAELISLGDDPIKLVRGKAGIVFRAFTALPIWNSLGDRSELYECSSFSDELVEGGKSRQIAWKEFDVAAFKEALKVYNQFQMNREKREEKLDSFALKLLVMDGEQAIHEYAGDSDQDRRIRSRLEKIWKDSAGKPKPPKIDSPEEVSIAHFAGDSRIDRLRRIINDDLAEEYRLTDGRKTPYGLRRRTMKGWGEVKRSWQKLVKVGESYSQEKRQKLNDALNELRSGDKREQIGSHRLFETLLSDEAAWTIWREPDDKSQDKIAKNGWAVDPLEVFREYCETREALEDVSARPLNFTPADARFSRRLFIFTDACSFGNDRGEFKHDLKSLSVTVPVAIRGADGSLAKRPCRISYSAPRLLRDGIRSEDRAYEQNWVQPMMRALFNGSSDKNLQELKDAAVQLMPDYDGQGRQRVLLNFPLSLDETKVKTHVGKSTVWQRQFVTWKRGDQLPFLRWTNEFDGKEPHRWFEQVNSFRALSADLGTRHVAGIAMIECSKEKSGLSRRIGNDGNIDWYAKYRSGVVLRLPGENAKVLRYSTKLDSDGEGKAFREELHGERGRSAEMAECQETLDILRDFGQLELLNGVAELVEIRKRFSFPGLNDKLLVALRRTQGWISVCVSWHWKLTKPEDKQQSEDALKKLQEQDRMSAWKSLAANGEFAIPELRNAIQEEILHQRELVTRHLLQLTRRVLPLRNRDWEWVVHPDKADCHLLRQTVEGTGSRITKLRGQRGLSIARIEQLSELRRRWQSLNQSLRRVLGERPPTAAEMRNDPIPDPCPNVLAKLEHIREQRINQTAHLILAQALGVRLCEPTMSAKSRRVTDTHGEYEKFRDPVDFIVLEDLSRYLSDQGRAKSENSRLLQWCHRAITRKLKVLAEVFGIPVLETPAAYSSRFCSLTGAVGFRVAEVGWNDRHEFRWKVLMDEAKKAITEGAQLSDNARFTKDLFDELKKISESSKPHRTLLAPQPGGPMFVTAKSVLHPAPSKVNKKSEQSDVFPIQADINAAINLALRAVAHPEYADIHHRVRTERKKGVVQVRENRRFGKDQKVSVLIRQGDSFPKDWNTNLFYDHHGMAQFGRARLDCDPEGIFPYASSPGIWKVANNRDLQWGRCQEINQSRLKQWNKRTDSEFEEEIPM